MDRAYVDYDWWERLTQQGVFFVTRCKADLQHEVVQERTVPQNRNIRADQLVRWAAITKAGTQTTLYRRIVVWVEDKQQEMAFFTNHLLGLAILANLDSYGFKPALRDQNP